MHTLFQGNKRETVEPVKADVRGTVPSWLQGTLLRNGPGMFSVGETSYNHWFDGLALLHSFTFKDGEVYYRSKYLRSETFTKNMQANRIVVSEFGTMAYPDPCKNIFSKVFSYISHTIPDFTDNCLINFAKYGKDFYATTETNYFQKIDPNSLETLQKLDYRKYVAVNLATSHPHYDDEGNAYNMGTCIVDFRKPKYTIFRIPSTTPESEMRKTSCLKSLDIVCSIPCRSALSPSYYHSFGMTDNYIIFIEQPFKLDILRLATAYYRGVNWASCLKFDADDITLIHLIDRKTGRPVHTKFYTEPLVLYHHINAYEEENHVIFDVITYKDNSLYDMFYLVNVQQDSYDFEQKNKLSSKPFCQRFVVPLFSEKGTEIGSNLVRLKSTTATAIKKKEDTVFCLPEVICEGVELPRINYDYNGKKYRYFYCTRVEWRPVPTKIAKVDAMTKQIVEWSEDDCWPAEPVFVPAPDAKEEDDGIILSSIVSSNPSKPPFMLILNAKTFQEIARASINADVHLDLHGIFIPRNSSG
ncbi:beta,beta-carotene 15,15'-dioxygenase [Erpetoichthys calabaricus]|uniref:Beta-carotene oxygenase 1, like n=1 Tax=Erpetoichthys calabaricus TaxID=27687 RepID=A0A8C4XDU1_ERPCA|nr:beta,beta-carotene 15,15'-dioxygenase [Erpetoichthys calabaricus]